MVRPFPSPIQCNNSTIFGDEMYIYGDHNRVIGDGNHIVGKYNRVTGNRNTIDGSFNHAKGDRNNFHFVRLDARGYHVAQTDEARTRWIRKMRKIHETHVMSKPLRSSSSMMTTLNNTEHQNDINI